MKKIVFLFLISFGFISLTSASLYGRTIDRCQLDPITGNRYCTQSLASRYRGNRINYSDSASLRQTQSFYRNQQVCPRFSRFEGFPINACVCQNGYKVSRDKTMCIKTIQPLSNEGVRVLTKALAGHELTLEEKRQRGEINRWLNEVFRTTPY